jgi:carbamoyl-phosphate synthase large subunit
MKILITGVGGPTPRSFANALKNFSTYTEYEFIGTDINPLAIGLYQTELFSKTYLVPPASDKNYWNVIENIIKENEIEYAIILPELEVLEWSKRQQEQALPCKTLLPDYQLAEFLVDKAKMTTVLQDMDVVPPSIEFTRNQRELDIIGNTLGYPYWVRSTSGSSGLGSLKIENVVSLQNWININPNVTHFLASVYLSGRNLACKLLYFEGRLIRAAVGERVNYIMAKVAPSGITGNSSFGRLLNEPEIVSIGQKAMERMFVYTNAKPHGFFTVDLKEDKQGKPYITEINVRHVAFTQCFAAGGANFAEDTMRLLDEDIVFDKEFSIYEFENDLIFLRDVDEKPILLKEFDLIKKIL